MDLVHYAGAPEQTVDDYVTAPSFFELGIKAGYTFRFEVLDSGYIYGPGAPRTYYLGLRLHSF